jgi:anaerobic ribonucleoside-triphosphate reductase activating protein
MEPANCALSLALTVNRIQLPVQNLGPGRRIGVWLQGCGRRCVLMIT